MNSSITVDGATSRPNPVVQQHAGHGHRRLQQHRAARQPPELGDAGLLLGPGPLRPDRAVARLRRGPGRNTSRPDHRRHRPRRLDADRQPGQLERHADDHLRLPVAALRRLRQQLRRHPRATGSTYTLGPDDVGSTIRVVVTAVNDAGSSNPATSAPTGTIGQLAPANVTLPVVSGTQQDGQTLTTTLGGWNGTAPLDYDVQWQRCDSRRQQLRRHRRRHRLELRAHRRRRRLDDPQRGHRLQRRRLRHRALGPGRARSTRSPRPTRSPRRSPASPATARR